MNRRTFRPKYLTFRSLAAAFEKRHPETPWLTESAVRLLEYWIRPSDIGFEWGSGRSTVWFAGRCAHLTSVDHSQEWYERVGHMIADAELGGRVTQLLFPCSASGCEQEEGRAYTDSILSIEDGTLDFVLVDGVMRATCFVNALKKLKHGGLLILDNSDRYLPNSSLGAPSTEVFARCDHAGDEWRRASGRVADWRCILTTNRVTETRMWIKPCKED